MFKSNILPAVIPRSLEDLVATLDRVSFAKEIQLDLVDGVFASPASWPYDSRSTASDAAPLIAPFSVELDLMVQDPLAAAKEWYALGVNRFIVHLEASALDLDKLIAWKQETGVTLGASIANDTPLSILTSELHRFDFVQLMGIDTIGGQGRPFDERVLDRIRTLRAEYPDIIISIDGAVSEATLPLLKAAAANRFVAGSAILNSPDPKSAYEQLSLLAE